MQMMIALIPGIMTSGDMMSANTMATTSLMLAKGVYDPVLQVSKAYKRNCLGVTEAAILNAPLKKILLNCLAAFLHRPS